MSRRRRVAKGRRSSDIPEHVRCILCDQPVPELDREDAFDLFIHTYFRRSGSVEGLTIEDYWRDHRDVILPAWAQQYPGTRPTCWWEFDAPRWERCPSLAVPRLRMGGGGLAQHEAAATASWRFGNGYLRCGIPQGWWSRPTHDAPPLFESEPAYLRRHGLLPAIEAKRLRAIDFEPEIWTLD